MLQGLAPELTTNAIKWLRLDIAGLSCCSYSRKRSWSRLSFLMSYQRLWLPPGGNAANFPFLVIVSRSRADKCHGSSWWWISLSHRSWQGAERGWYSITLSWTMKPMAGDYAPNTDLKPKNKYLNDLQAGLQHIGQMKKPTYHPTYSLTKKKCIGRCETHDIHIQICPKLKDLRDINFVAFLHIIIFRTIGCFS